MKLFAATAVLWAAMWAVSTRVQPVSRRACNAAYILWMLAFNLQVSWQHNVWKSLSARAQTSCPH